MPPPPLQKNMGGKKQNKKKNKKTRNTSQPIGCTPATEEKELLLCQNLEKGRKGRQKEEFPKQRISPSLLSIKKEYGIKSIA